MIILNSDKTITLFSDKNAKLFSDKIWNCIQRNRLLSGNDMKLSPDREIGPRNKRTINKRDVCLGL